MRIVIQRVLRASVSIGGALHSSIGQGLLVLVGVENGDTPDDARWLADKTAALRIFDDENGVQFEPVANGTVTNEPTELSLEAAQRVLSGENTVGDALYFFAPALSQGTWIDSSRTYQQTIGCHRFYN